MTLVIHDITHDEIYLYIFLGLGRYLKSDSYVLVIITLFFLHNRARGLVLAPAHCHMRFWLSISVHGRSLIG